MKEVQSDKILFTQKDEQGNVVVKELPMGFCLWSTGVGKIVHLQYPRDKRLTMSSPDRFLCETGEEA